MLIQLLEVSKFHPKRDTLHVCCLIPATFLSPEADLILVSTKNCDLWEGPILGACAKNLFCVSATGIFRFDSEHAQNDGKSVNRRLPVLDLPRGRDSWC